MVFSAVRSGALLEVAVMVFQVLGVLGLCLWRLLPAQVWAYRARFGFVLAMIGLGIAGALCGRHDSEFALFAGGTMTTLLIGMSLGGGPADLTGPPALLVQADPSLAA